MSWRATVPCSRAQAQAIADDHYPFEDGPNPPVLVADEPDASAPEAWLIRAYFDHCPTSDEIARLTGMGIGPPQIEQLAEEDWVTLSQAGLQPIRAGRFHVHTPTCSPDPERINFEIDAGLAFGTGQHATTAGCLDMLDALERAGGRFSNIADIGTGTGLLAFAALALWPRSRCIATDIDQVAVDVARENATINGIKLGHAPGELLLAQADGLDCGLIAARAPFDLVVANILAAPLIALAPAIATALVPDGRLILAGLLHTQADTVGAAYHNEGLSVLQRTPGEWPIVLCKRDN